jgi:hypothetical protein
MDEGVKMVDFDCTEDKLFVLADDLTLFEVSLESDEIKKEVNLG